LKTHNVQVNNNKAHRILAFNRETFDKDLLELHRRTDLDIIYFPMFVYGSFLTAFILKYMKHQIHYHSLNSPEELRAKNILQKACNNAFPYLKKLLRFEAMISANIDYSQDQVWIEAGRKFNVPFISVCKEGIQCDSHFKYILNLYKNPGFRFRGQKITVICNRKRHALVKAGVAKPENIVVTGAARTDGLHDIVARKKSWNVQKKKWVVLFTFKHQFFKAYQLWEGMFLAFIDAAITDKNNGFDYIIKTRNREESAKIHARLSQARADSIKVDHKTTFEEIAENAAVSIGYNTTALVEVMATLMPVVVPHFEEATINLDSNMLISMAEQPIAYHVAYSPGEMTELIRRIIASPWLSPNIENVRYEREKIIEKFLHRIDGKRSHEIASEIRQTIALN
jgi:hypothetical protein